MVEDHKFEDNGLMKRLGNGQILELDEQNGRAVVQFYADPDMGHSGGIVQGGFVSGWIDNAMAMAAIAYSRRTQNMATLELKVSFFAPARVGVLMRSEGWIERAGKRIMFMEGRLTDQDGEIIAKASSTGRWVPMPVTT